MVTPWHPLILTVAVNNSSLQNPSATQLLKLLIDKITKTEDSLYALLCYLCLVGLAKRLSTNSYRWIEAVSLALASLCNLGQYYEFFSSIENKKVRVWKADPLVSRFMSKVYINKKQVIDLGGTYTFLCEELKNYCLLSDWIVGTTIRTEDISLPVRITLSNEEHIKTISLFKNPA